MNITNSVCCAFAGIVCLIASTISYAQSADSSKEEISNKINDYFLLDRENIHVQFNKNSFFSTEDIWFKGYVYNRKAKSAFKVTTNVFVSLLDENGNKIKEQLVYGQNGSFQGNLDADASLPSGTYYIQVYTNWMNNFAENESYIQKINILNKDDSEFAGIQEEAGVATVAFQPEGGKLIKGTKSVLGVKFQDCHNRVSDVTEAMVLNAQGEQIKKVFIDKSGYGKFDLPWGDEKYSLKYTSDGNENEVALPMAEEKGFALEVNNYSLEDKTIVTISSNPGTLEEMAGKEVFLVVHQDNSSSVFDVELDPETLSQQLIFSGENLSVGVNTIRLVDSNLNQLAERLIFQPLQQNGQPELQVNKRAKDSITISGTTGANMNLSVSVLPGESIASRESSGIFSSFLLHPYLKEKVVHNNYVFNNPTKAEHYELDLFLLNQKSGKYAWENITSSPPVDKYKFDLGIQLKGALDANLKKADEHKIQLFSVSSEVDERTQANSNREFYFDNLILADSSWVNIGIYNKGNQLVKTNVFPQVVNGKGNYIHAYSPESPKCPQVVTKKSYEMPAFAEEFVQLDEVELKGEKVEQYKYADKPGNQDLTAFKITERDEALYRDILQYIESNSTFTVLNSQGNVAITSRQSTSLRGGQATPIVYLNDVQLFDLSILSLIRMFEVDEVYINSQTIVPSIRNNIGVIKIYRKGGFETASKNGVIPYQIVNGFAVQKPFKNSFYYTTSGRGFSNFGLIHWIPNLNTSDNKKFEFQVPNMNQDELKVFIEGFSADGQLVSEVRTISVN